MAEGKKSFILYTDLLTTVSKLNDNKAGKLFKIILEYVNDLNPQVTDLLIQVAFEPVKQQLKRDLKDWESERHSRSEAGKLGAEKRWSKRKKMAKDGKNGKAISSMTKMADTVTVTVNDTVTVKERESNTREENFKSFYPGPEHMALELPEIKRGAVIQWFATAKKMEATGKEINELWGIFKAQYFNGKKWYASIDDVYSHFINWSQTKKIENGKGHKGNNGKSAGAEKLIDSFRDELTREAGGFNG